MNNKIKVQRASYYIFTVPKIYIHNILNYNLLHNIILKMHSNVTAVMKQFKILILNKWV